jgi:hypothetical protein
LLRGAQRRHQATDDHREGRQREAEPEHRPVRACLDSHLGNASRQTSQQRHQQNLKRPPREQRAGDASNHGDEDALGEHVPNQSPPPRAEGQAHCHFSPPALGSSHEDVGDVGAREQQHQSERPQHDGSNAQESPPGDRQGQRPRGLHHQRGASAGLLPVDCGGDES